MWNDVGYLWPQWVKYPSRWRTICANLSEYPRANQNGLVSSMKLVHFENNGPIEPIWRQLSELKPLWPRMRLGHLVEISVNKKRNMENLCCTVWKLRRYTLMLFWQKFRESNSFTKYITVWKLQKCSYSLSHFFHKNFVKALVLL